MRAEPVAPSGDRRSGAGPQFFLAGADPWEGDRLGRLALTKAGLAARDGVVLDRAERWGSATCVVLAGGYAPDLADTVDINPQTARVLVARAGG